MEYTRRHSRLPIHIPVGITLSNGDIIEGQTKSISFGGMFVELDAESDNESGIKANDVCSAILELQEDMERLTIEFKCKVVYSTKTGVGIQYLSINGPGYTQFKDLIVANSPDPEKIISELELHPVLITNTN